MRTCCVIFVCLLFSFAHFAQDHGSAIANFKTLEEAEAYADRYREVSVGMVNELVDKFIFEEIDTSDLGSNLGKSFSNFGRTNYLLKDTILEFSEVEIIRFDLKKTNETTADILLNQMQKRIDAGDSYWDVKKKFSHTSAWFHSGPEVLSDLVDKYNIQITEPSDQWVQFANSEMKGLIRFVKHHDQVKAFYVIGYNSL